MRDGVFVVGVVDVLYFNVVFVICVYVFCGVVDGYCIYYFFVVEGVDLSSMSGNFRFNEGIGGKRNRLYLVISSNMEGVCFKWKKIIYYKGSYSLEMGKDGDFFVMVFFFEFKSFNI